MARRRSSPTLDRKGFAHCGRKLAKGKGMAVNAWLDGFAEYDNCQEAGMNHEMKLQRKIPFMGLKIGRSLGRPSRRSLFIGQPSAKFSSEIPPERARSGKTESRQSLKERATDYVPLQGCAKLRVAFSLHGNFNCTRDNPTLGSILFKDYYPDRDSFVAEKLRKAGAIIWL